MTIQRQSKARPVPWLRVVFILAVLSVLWWRPAAFFGPQLDAPPPGTVEYPSVLVPSTEQTPASSPGRSEAGDARGDTFTQRPGPTADVLYDEGQGVYRSSAGLVYTRGSEHGHRLQHVLMHGQDQPDRPGQHGVFADGRQESIVALIDEAYLQAQRNEGTHREQDRQRTILTVDLRRVVGFIGGEVGNRRGRPPAHHVRLVVEGRRVITAFPVVP